MKSPMPGRLQAKSARLRFPRWNKTCSVTGKSKFVYVCDSKLFEERTKMNNLFRGLIAGAAAWKLGGGLISTILIFVVVFWLLGKC
jgi:hypothetical protein